MNLDTLLLSLLVVLLWIIFLLPILISLWLWYFHDRLIRPLREEIIDTPSKIQEQFRGRGVTTSGIEPHINAALRPLKIELEKLESARQLFIDRAKFISLFKIG